MRFALALALILAASSGGAVEPADVSVIETPSSVRIETGAARAEIRRRPFRLKLRGKDSGRRLFGQQH